MLETEIIPAFFNQDKEGVSKEWAGRVKNTLAEIAPNFTMERMLNDYVEKYYNSLIASSKVMKEKDTMIPANQCACTYSSAST